MARAACSYSVHSVGGLGCPPLALEEEGVGFGEGTGDDDVTVVLPIFQRGHGHGDHPGQVGDRHPLFG